MLSPTALRDGSRVSPVAMIVPPLERRIRPQPLVPMIRSTTSTPPLPTTSVPLRTSRKAVWVALVTNKLPPLTTVTRPDAVVAQSPTTRLDQTVAVPPEMINDPCEPPDWPTIIDKAWRLPAVTVNWPVLDPPTIVVPLVITSRPPVTQTAPAAPLMLPMLRSEETFTLPPATVRVPHEPAPFPTLTRADSTMPFETVICPVPVLPTYKVFG